jgi:hypothetical protein
VLVQEPQELKQIHLQLSVDLVASVEWEALILSWEEWADLVVLVECLQLTHVLQGSALPHSSNKLKKWDSMTKKQFYRYLYRQMVMLI